MASFKSNGKYKNQIEWIGLLLEQLSREKKNKDYYYYYYYS